MAWMIDGNKLKEKAVFLLFPTKMEPCGYLPHPVQAVTVSEIEGMLYREGVQVVLCKECKYYMTIHCTCDGCCISDDWYCADGERKENE